MNILETGRAVGQAGYGDTRTSTAPKPVNPSCFGNVEDVSTNSSAVAQNVERLVARLCGAQPAEGSGEPSPAPNGLFEEADTQARYIRANLARIQAAMDRLEKHLP